ncbi:hypothetical protein [Tenacibaculum sp. 190524A05c]|uniref:hypothetical protein n=1 Tax=Tenacibaculum platacis TaxID=3137852 RepID=UPI0031FAD2B2
MIYDSIDVIPAKLFFKVLETGKLSLLSAKNELSKEKLAQAWSNIIDEYESQDPDKDSKKRLQLSTQIEVYKSRMKLVSYAVSALRIIKDEELIELLKSYKYKQTNESFNDFLDRVERENSNEKVRISKYEAQLEQLEIDEPNENTSFDEVVISFSVIAGTGFIDTNKITLSQYLALIKVGSQKIKALEEDVER